jgi:phage FluMu protein Com
MKRNTVLKSTLAISVLGALILAGGCQSMGGKGTVKCPKCNQKVVRVHPKKGMQYKKVACPSCKMIMSVDDKTGAATATHACDACGVLVGECPKCAAK